MNKAERIVFDKLISEYSKLRINIEEIISISECEPERLKMRVENFGATTFKHLRSEIRTCIEALNEQNTPL